MNARDYGTAFRFWIPTLVLLLAVCLHAQSSAPAGWLEKLTSDADLVFKGQVIASRALSNSSFPDWAKPHATQFHLVSVLKGKPETNEPVLWHYTAEPMAWSGGATPSPYQFETGRCYLVFAAKLNRPDHLYTPPPDATNRPNEYRQLYRDCVTRTLDARPLDVVSIKEAHWLELNLLLNDAVPTNSLYAIQRLDSLSPTCGSYDWPHSKDFTRERVLTALKPFIEHPNDSVAIAAIGCFHIGSECSTQLLPHADALITIAEEAKAVSRRTKAIAVLSGLKFPSIRDALPRWLTASEPFVRAEAVALLNDFPGDFADESLRKLADDQSPKVRAAVADAIGNGKFEQLLATLAKLFTDPVGREKPLGPLTIEDLEGGGRIVSTNFGDVHTSAGYALLKFEANQVGAILKTNLNDAGFRLGFLCKLAENDAAPWLEDMAEVMETRRVRNLKKAEAHGTPPGTYMHLSGTYNRCWKIIYEHLKGLPYVAFANGKSDRYLTLLEQAGSTGSQEPLMIYELYRMKGLNKRAARFRTESEKAFAWASISQFFDKVDARYPNNGVIPDQ